MFNSHIILSDAMQLHFDVDCWANGSLLVGFYIPLLKTTKKLYFRLCKLLIKPFIYVFPIQILFALSTRAVCYHFVPISMYM